MRISPMKTRGCCNQSGRSKILHPGTFWSLVRSPWVLVLLSCFLSRVCTSLTSLMRFLCITPGREFFALPSRSMTQFMLFMSLHSKGSLLTDIILTLRPAQVVFSCTKLVPGGGQVFETIFNRGGGIALKWFAFSFVKSSWPDSSSRWLAGWLAGV